TTVPEKTAAPEPTVAAAPQSPIAESLPSLGRPVAPEPKVVTAASLPQPSIEPVVAQPSPAPTKRDGAADLYVGDTAQPQQPTKVAAQTEPSLPIKAIGRAWAEPASLLADLEQLKRNASARPWATETTSEIHKLGPAIAVGAPQTSEILSRLDELV